MLEQFADQATASISFDELFKTQDSVPYDQCTFFIDNLEGGEDTEGGTDESCDNGGLWKGVCNATISEGEGSCSVYYGEHTAISAPPNTCPAGEVQKVKPPAWWDYCLSNPANSVSKDVACPGGCGTCKKPDNPTAEVSYLYVHDLVASPPFTPFFSFSLPNLFPHCPLEPQPYVHVLWNLKYSM